MSLEYWKREKNFRALGLGGPPSEALPAAGSPLRLLEELLEKGYARDPEGFPFKFLLKRLREETDELEVALINETGSDEMPVDQLYYDSQVEEIIKECADVSNLVDYIASKALTQRADVYKPDASRSTHVDLGLREGSQLGEAQPGPGCPPGFQDYCVDEVGTACPYYHEGHCAKACSEEMER